MQPTLIAADAFAQIVESVWETVLGLPTEPIAAPVMNDEVPDLSVCVPITGTWNGTVLFCPTARFASKATAILFAIPESDVTKKDIHDGMAELGNIVAGNLKSLLPGSSALSLPAVTRAPHREAWVRKTRLAAHVAFACEGEQLSFRLLEGAVPACDDTHTTSDSLTKG